MVEATSSHFFRVTTSTKQLLFWGSNFFRTAAVFSFFTFSEQSLFWRSYFFRIASFSERKIYRATTSREQEVLYGSYFSEQLFFSEELFRIRYLKKSYFFKAGTSAQHQLFQTQPAKKRFKNVASTLVFMLCERFWNVIFGKFI